MNGMFLLLSKANAFTWELDPIPLVKAVVPAIVQPLLHILFLFCWDHSWWYTKCGCFQLETFLHPNIMLQLPLHFSALLFWESSSELSILVDSVFFTTIPHFFYNSLQSSFCFYHLHHLWNSLVKVTKTHPTKSTNSQGSFYSNSWCHFIQLILSPLSNVFFVGVGNGGFWFFFCSPSYSFSVSFGASFLLPDLWYLECPKAIFGPFLCLNSLLRLSFQVTWRGVVSISLWLQKVCLCWFQTSPISPTLTSLRHQVIVPNLTWPKWSFLFIFNLFLLQSSTTIHSLIQFLKVLWLYLQNISWMPLPLTTSTAITLSTRHRNNFMFRLLG